MHNLCAVCLAQAAAFFFFFLIANRKAHLLSTCSLARLLAGQGRSGEALKPGRCQASNRKSGRENKWRDEETSAAAPDRSFRC